MSIFPKRTIAGSTVTIHWNFNVSHIMDSHVFPYVRIGVQSPQGEVTMLFEDHVLGLPRIEQNAAPEMKTLLHLNKSTPLLVLADYLSTHDKRATLVEILENIQAGRHYYFTYNIPTDAPPGKYALISSVYNSGKIKYSQTAADDHFFVEKIIIKEGNIVSHSPEPIPVKIVSYYPGQPLRAKDIMVFELQPMGTIAINTFPKNAVLFYNEERVILPLSAPTDIRCIRNQTMLSIPKDDKLHVMVPDGEVYTLDALQLQIWESADGFITRKELFAPEHEAQYLEMVDNQLILEIKYSS